MKHLRNGKEEGMYDIVDLSTTQLNVICFLLETLDNRCFTEEAGEFYGNDNFAVKLNAEQRKALRDFVAELRPNKD